jgi:DNA-binding transcriptional LysR family regulator
MDLAGLQTFLAVMRRGSFAAVARELEVDPSSVSRAIIALEARLGVRLFQRTTRRLAPTEAALAYAAQVEPLIAQLEAAAQVASDRGDAARGALRITAPVMFAQGNLLPLLPGLAQRHPGLSFELLLSDQVLDLVDARIDVALRLGRLADSSLIAHRLCDMVYVAAAAPSYLRARGTPQVPTDLAAHDCLRYPVAGHGARWRFQRGTQPPEEVAINGRVVAANGVALRACAVAGMGIVLLPRWGLADELRRGALVQVLDGYRASVSALDGAAWLVYPSRSYVPAKVRVFVDHVRAAFRAGAPAEVGLPPVAPPPRRRGR